MVERMESGDGAEISPRKQGEGALDAKFMMEPEARDVLESMRFNNFENTINALEEFFGNMQVDGEEITFMAATKVLDTALKAFCEIDQNGNGVLSKVELENFASHEEDEVRYEFQWLSANVDILSKASLIPDAAGGVSRSDLAAARDVFRGLDHLQNNFDGIAKVHADGKKSVTSDDVDAYIGEKGDSLDEEEKSGLTQLIKYMDRLNDGQSGLTQESIDQASARKLWNSRKPRKG